MIIIILAASLLLLLSLISPPLTLFLFLLVVVITGWRCCIRRNITGALSEVLSCTSGHIKLSVTHYLHFDRLQLAQQTMSHQSVVYRGRGGLGCSNPPEIPKISVESSIA